MRNQEKQSVVERLREYRRQIDELMELIGGKTALSNEEKAEAQQRMKALKEGLKRDYEFGATLRGQAQMTETQKHSFHPAIHEAYCEIRSAWNSNPIKSNWFDQLDGCRFEIDYRLQHLEKE